jgi:uncharacterized protein YciI
MTSTAGSTGEPATDEEVSVATFVVEFRYRVDGAERQAVHPDHVANLRDLAERGVLLLGGPLVDDNGGLLIYEVADRDELQAVLDTEPYLKAGFVAESRVLEWQPRMGSWTAGLTRT